MKNCQALLSVNAEPSAVKLVPSVLKEKRAWRPLPGRIPATV